MESDGELSTDYTVRTTRRTDSGHVLYVVCDRYGQLTHVTVPFRLSVPELVDPIIRRVVAATPRRRLGL